jgi:hypothetical protein
MICLYTQRGGGEAYSVMRELFGRCWEYKHSLFHVKSVKAICGAVCSH